MSSPVWRLKIDKDALKAHQAWIDRGKSGPGRVAFEDQNFRGLQARMSLAGARFVRCDLSQAELALVTLDDVELVECKLDGATLNSAELKRAQISQTTFVRAVMQVVHFASAQLRGCSFVDANLERSNFAGTTLDHVNLVGVRLVDAVFDDARLVACDLRGADLSRGDRDLDLARTTRTRFERCDLRGANLAGRRLDGTVFDQCQLDGTRGKPELVGAYTVTAPTGITAAALAAAWR